MLPTFDFSNLLRKIVFAGGWTFINPVVWTVTLAIAVGSVVTAICSSLDFLQIPNIPASFSSPSSDLYSLLCYTLALDQLFSVINCIINFISLMIPFSITTLVAFVGSCYAWRSSTVIRKAWMSLASK